MAKKRQRTQGKHPGQSGPGCFIFRLSPCTDYVFPGSTKTHRTHEGPSFSRTHPGHRYARFGSSDTCTEPAGSHTCTPLMRRSTCVPSRRNSTAFTSTQSRVPQHELPFPFLYLSIHQNSPPPPRAGPRRPNRTDFSGQKEIHDSVRNRKF